MSFSGSRCRWCVVLLIATTVGVVLPVQGQVPPKKGPVPPTKAPVPPTKGPVPPTKGPVPPSAVAPNGPKTPAPPPKKGPKVPEPEDVGLETKDGMAIKATYYPGTLKKEAVPFILVHGLDGQRGDMHGLAVYLQSLGYAAMAPDLRGHGQSKSQKRPDGAPLTLDPDKLTRPMLEAMILDIQACKKYLMEKNNSGDLNIEQLCVVGAEFGAILAVRWAAMDWTQQDLPAYKLGKDVKALVLLSPPASHKAVSLREALTVPPVSSSLAMLIVAGADDTKASNEAEKLHKQLQTHHSKSSDDKDLFLLQPPTNLSGAKLLDKTLDIKEKIASFVEKTLVSKKTTYAWQDRKNPL